MAKLTDEEVRRQLKPHPKWSYKDDSLVREFTLQGFMDVIELVNTVAKVAEKADHHPDMTIKFKRITFTLSTHDEGGVTEKDFNLLRAIEASAT